MFAAVARKIPLAVTIDIQAPHRPAALHGLFPDSGVHGFPAPVDILWQPDVH
jgi:hypothetical protein